MDTHLADQHLATGPFEATLTATITFRRVHPFDGVEFDVAPAGTPCRVHDRDDDGYLVTVNVDGQDWEAWNVPADRFEAAT